MEEQFKILLESSQEFVNQIARAIPQIVGAVLILIIGWLIAKLVKKLTIKLLKLVKLSYLTEKSGVDKFLKDGGSKLTTIDLIGSLLYWLIMLIVIMSALNSVQLTSAEVLFNKIILFIPNIIVAIIILLLGLYLARFISQALAVALNGINDKAARLMESISYYAIIVLTVFIVLSQLDIAENIVNIAFLLILGGVCLAFGLAFGLGGKGYAENMLKKLHEIEKKPKK